MNYLLYDLPTCTMVECIKPNVLLILLSIYGGIVLLNIIITKIFKLKVMIAKKDGKYHLYDESNKQIGKFSCDDVDVITTDGVFAFERDGKWGFADLSGKEVIDAQFDSAKSFSKGLAAVCKEDKGGFVDESGKLVIDYQFVDADYFNSERYCFVKTTPGTWQMIQLKVNF